MIGVLFSLFGGMLLEPGLRGAQLPVVTTADLQYLPTHSCYGKPKADPKEKGKIKVTVVVILACNKSGPIDESLKKIAQEIQRFEKELKCFKLKSMKCKSLAVDEVATFPLVEKQVAVVIVKKTADEKNRVVVAVKPPKQKQFQYRTVCGKFLPIITRYHTSTGERLILAIRVQPCRDD